MIKIRVSISIALAFVVFACVPKQYHHDLVAPGINNILTVGVGDEFFRRELMYGEDNYAGSIFKGDATMFTLTVVGLNEKMISLQYREFTKPVAGPYGGFRYGGSWLIKDGYNQKYEYDLSLKKIRFKEYEFEVIGFNEGRIQYKRIS